MRVLGSILFALLMACVLLAGYFGVLVVWMKFGFEILISSRS